MARWFILKGTAPSDQEYDAAVERAAAASAARSSKSANYTFDAANPRTDSGHQQIQTQMPEVTQGAPEHDVVWVADTVERFGEYVPYRDYDPRPVVGTQGLIAVAWHRSYEQYAGTQMQHRFERFAKRVMTERDYSAWLAVRAIGEAAPAPARPTSRPCATTSCRRSSPSPASRGRGSPSAAGTISCASPMLITGARSSSPCRRRKASFTRNSSPTRSATTSPRRKCKFSN